LEICNLESEDDMLFTCVRRFPHRVDYVIGAQVLLVGNETKLVLHCGNNLGEVFIYEVDPNKKQEVDANSGAVTADNLRLLDMVFTVQEQTESLMMAALSVK